MKVYIGNYPTTWLRCRIHTNYMNRKYGRHKWINNKTKFEDFLERVEDTIQVFYNATINVIMEKRERKVKIRIDDYDTWNMDSTLALIILPMLKQLRNTKNGSAFVDDEDVPEHLRSTAAPPKENEWDTDDNFFKRWDWVLDEIIFAFETKNDEDWDLRIYKKFGNDWPAEAMAERNAIRDRMQNGFRLFGKYYQGLWD